MRCGLFTLYWPITQLPFIPLIPELFLSRIKILSEHLANQIAAGEVIERPASVVKELLENSIDAGASHVQIEIQGNGTRLIRVLDDGTGMDADDALLCLERHATSKLGESPDDSSRLAAIHSLGFRGEAIPSIASVAKMSITTRTEKNSLGTRVEVRFGKILKVHEVGCNKGTVIEVKDLFGNLPARKKFLKTPRTELGHIDEIIKNYSLANCRLGITYTANNSPVLDLAAESDTLEDRVKLLYARNIIADLIPLQEQNSSISPENTISVQGFLLSPEHSFGVTSRLRLFVNGRAVKDRMIAHAVSEGLAGYLLKGRSAAGVVFVNLPYEAVDVNVHPTKQEIRFQQPSRVHEKIVSAVRAAMAKYQKKTRQTLFGSNLEWQDNGSQQTKPAAQAISERKNIGTFWAGPDSGSPETASADHVPDNDLLNGSGVKPFPVPDESKIFGTAEPAAPFVGKAVDELLVPESLKPIGQLLDLYLLCEAKCDDEQCLVVIDQHAVHERILFENLKKQFAARQMTSQNLLFPKMLELTPEYAAAFQRHREEILRLGLDVEEFGGDSFIVKAVPAIISHLAPEEILTGILHQFAGPEYGADKGKKHSDATRLDDILSTMACKAAVKAGQNLNQLEMHELLKLMRESKAFTHCPHGRPVVRIFSEEDIKKWFHRT